MAERERTERNFEETTRENTSATTTMKAEHAGNANSSSDERTTSSGDQDEEKTNNFAICSPIRSPPSSDSNITNPFSNSQSKGFSKGILKPPQLSLCSTSTSSNSLLLPSKLTNVQSSNEASSSSSSFNPSSSSQPKLEKNSKSVVESDLNSVKNGTTPKFIPLIQSENKSNSTIPTATSPSNKMFTSLTNSTFVFGQNLQDRVIAENKPDEPKPSTSVNSNGTTDMLFTSSVQHDVRAEGTSPNKEAKSLSESAREYEESRAVKRKYEEVEVKTGEEEETNILSTSCKLFAFDKSSGSWQERGRGNLRLNDYEIETVMHSRLVFRTSGSLRVILNTKIWAEMTIQQASEKSIRLTALDANGEIKVFLIMANIEDTKQLYSHLQTRLNKEISLQKRRVTETSSSKSEGGN